MGFNIDVPVLAQHNDIVHLQTMKGITEKAVQGGNLQAAQSFLRHAGAHYTAAVAKKSFKGADANTWKQWLSEVEKAVNEAIQQKQAQQAQQQQMQNISDTTNGVGMPPPGSVPNSGVQPQPQPQPMPAQPPGPPPPKVTHTVQTKHHPITGRVLEAKTTQTQQG